jgi:hypothetical protein
MANYIHKEVLLTCCVLLFACHPMDRQWVNVTGEIRHLGRCELHISYYTDTHTLAYDTVYSNEAGKFNFKLPASDEITPITVYFKDHTCWTTLFAKAGDAIKITGDIRQVDLLHITGGKVNNDLTRFKEEIKPLYLERQAIIEGKYQRGGDKGLVEVRLAEINLALKRKAKEFILANPASVASVVLIQDFFYQDYDPNTGELLNMLEGEAKDNRLTKRLKEGMLTW